MLVKGGCLARDGKEEAEDQRKGFQKGILLPGVDVPIGVNFMVRDVGCERQDKSLTDVWGSPPQEGQMGLGISPILSR